ncbi:MAG: flavin reductase family protein [Burkholderiales bacterium]|jgi:flavin reductase|nr:flavin reductase family protein [Burkholderiales bacterium]
MQMTPPVLDTDIAETATLRAAFVAAMGTSASAVHVVTTDGPGGRRGLTVSAVASASADPPLLTACINAASPACDAITANGVFAVNLLRVDQRTTADRFAGRAADGAPYDFDRTQWHADPSGAPLLDDAAAQFVCAVEQVVEVGSHRLFVGRVLRADSARDAAPLVYCARRYGRFEAPGD